MDSRPVEYDVEQGTPEWRALRRGRITGSRANSLFRRTSRGWATGRAHMVSTIAMERLHGERAASGEGAAQRRGHDNEAAARDAYSFHTGAEVELVGFMTRSDHPMEGVSPDGLVGSDGAVEFKVPTALEKHVDYVLNGSHVAEYEGQLRHTLYVTGRAWIDVVSYYPEAAPNLQLAIRRVTRADVGMADYPEMLDAAWAEIDARAEALVAVQRAAMEAA